MSEKLIDGGPVLLDLEDGVASLRLNRPEASNGLNIPMLHGLHDALMTCLRERSVRVVLLTGEGPNFCAGGDVHEFLARGDALPDYIREATSLLQTCASAMIRLPAPIIAVVHGFAAGGGGLGLVCASDVVVAAESARFLPGATRVGMAPDAGLSVTLTQLVGLRAAMDLMLTNPTLTATEARQLGIVSRVVPDDELHAAAYDVAATLRDGAPLALAATKRLVWDGLGSSVDARLGEEARTVSVLSGTRDAQEGLAAVVERRKPNFTGK